MKQTYGGSDGGSDGGMKVDERDLYPGSSPLHHAARSGHSATFEVVCRDHHQVIMQSEESHSGFSGGMLLLHAIFLGVAHLFCVVEQQDVGICRLERDVL